MLLTKLYEFSQRADIKAKLPIEGYSDVKITWLIAIDLNGNLLGFISHAGEDRATKNGTSMTVPNLIRSSGTKPKLLADNGEYVLGISKTEGDTKVAQRHESFKQLVKQCADATEEASVIAVAKFLESWHPETNKSQLPQEFDPTQNVTFMVNFPDGSSVIPADVKAGLTKVQNFWADYVCGDGETSGDRPILTCLVTGEEREVEERLPVKIKGIPNGQTAGTALVSANAAPFVSYGLPNCLTSPICREAGEGFAKALNYLISSEDSRFYLNNSVVYVFWTKKATGYKLAQACKRNQPGKIRKVFQSALAGKRRDRLKTNQFYAVGLTASGGRAVVRDWLETTLDKAMENLIAWWDGQEIVNPFGEYNEKRYFGIEILTESLYRDPKKDAIARISAKLLHVAIQGDSLDILAQLIRRNRAERDVTHKRAALIKLVLTTQKKYKNAMTNMQCLNTEPNFEDESDLAAYHCGRLLAQLERIQETALGKDVNATLIDRFYGAASTTPGKVFGGLVKDAQAHLSRIRKDKRGAYEALQQKLEDILCNISPEKDKLPNNLTMQQQSIFALGYYHQRAKNRKDAIDAKEAKNAKANNIEVAESSEE